MSGLLRLRRESDQKKQHSSPQRSAAVPDTHAAPVTAKPAGAGKDKPTKWTKWTTRLFGQLEKKTSIREEKPSTTQESATDATSDAKTTEPKKRAKKVSWWCQVLKWCQRKHCVAPAPVPDPAPAPTKTHNEDNIEEDGSSFSHQDEVMAFSSLDDALLTDLTDFTDLVEALLEEQRSSINTEAIRGSNSFAVKPIDPYGFPNLGQTCYMNSSLQSLLTLEDFMRDVNLMESVWSLVPEAQLIRRLLEIRDAHTSTDSRAKSVLLDSFKKEVSVQNPEFGDMLQKDAHEFLISVLNQIRNLGPLLHKTAACMGRSYTCPIEDHLVFSMENTRTCKRCGAQSTRQEEFTNLSLDLVSGGSVEDQLQEYLMETELEFRCECGGNTSGQRSSFATLPRVLILQMKRFRFSPADTLEKAEDPIRPLTELVVSSKEGDGCYSLVSAISHFGTIDRGHYICDSIHPDADPEDNVDRWLTFDDAMVHETTSSSIREQRQDAAYILFYKREV